MKWKGDESSSVVPDIIVHQRGTQGPNYLVIEVKKSSNLQTIDDDMAKLKAMRTDLSYQHALFLRFGVKEQAGAIAECGWA